MFPQVFSYAQQIFQQVHIKKTPKSLSTDMSPYRIKIITILTIYI